MNLTAFIYLKLIKYWFTCIHSFSNAHGDAKQVFIVSSHPWLRIGKLSRQKSQNYSQRQIIKVVSTKQQGSASVVAPQQDNFQSQINKK